jgi:site-specific recombinase XerD
MSKVKSVKNYVDNALSDKTSICYASDLRHFAQWGGRLPSTPKRVASYLADHATKLTYATLSRRLNGIKHAHTSNGFRSPTDSALVRSTMQGIRRVEGCKQRQLAPITVSQLKKMLSFAEGLSGLRDKAILLLCYMAALKRSQLVSIDVEDLSFSEEGVLITLNVNSEEGSTRVVAVPYRATACPVRALKVWLKHSKISSGPVFRSFGKHGNLLGRLCGQSVALITKKYAEYVGLDSRNISSHSLRVGVLTEASKGGIETWRLCKFTGLKSVSAVIKSIRKVDPFSNSPTVYL